MFVSVLVSVFVSGGGDSFSFTMVVSVSFFSVVGFTVVCFCSQAASNPAPIRMQMNLFIGFVVGKSGRGRRRGRFRRSSGFRGSCGWTRLRRCGFCFLLTRREKRGTG